MNEPRYKVVNSTSVRVSLDPESPDYEKWVEFHAGRSYAKWPDHTPVDEFVAAGDWELSVPRSERSEPEPTPEPTPEPEPTSEPEPDVPSAESESDAHWREALFDPPTKAALDEGLADLAAGRVEPWLEEHPTEHEEL